jgi:DNA primase
MKNEEVSFAAIKQGVALEAVLKRYKVEGLKGGHKGRYRGRCPIHQGDGIDAFHVDVKRKIFHCFSCGAGGDLLELVARLERCTVRQAALQLKEWFPNAGVQRDPEIQTQLVTKGNRVVNRPLNFTLRRVDSRHCYLVERGIEERTAIEFGVGYYGGCGLMSGRVVIPIHDELGRLVAYAGRSVDGGQPRYRFPSGFGKSQVLFNFHRAAASESDTVVVVEGFFDCLLVSQAGYTSVVALMGTELYEAPARLLQDRFARVMLMLDGDAAGRTARVRVANRLKDKCAVRVVELADGAQPDHLPNRELHKLLGEHKEIEFVRVLRG